MKKLLLIFILFLATTIYASENIVDYSDTSLPILNDELRKLNDGVRNTHSIPAGGTAGQVLVKDTATNYDISWTTLSIPTHGSQIFTSSGVFTAPAGVTQVFISGCGAGGDGGSVNWGNVGGGGSSGKCTSNYPYTVVPGNSYTVTINATGTSEFDTLILAKGTAGSGDTPTSAGGPDKGGVFGLSGRGTDGVGDHSTGCMGGNGLFGTGGAAPAHASNGKPGIIYGGGGGGADATGAVGVTTGGVGAKGIIIVNW